MPTNERRRAQIAAAVAAYDRANPLAPLPHNATRLLIVMFPVDDVCERSWRDIACDGFGRSRVYSTLRRLIRAGLLSWQKPALYRLHLPAEVAP
jgi:hypothetical protein